jgi:hypothetical protein
MKILIENPKADDDLSCVGYYFDKEPVFILPKVFNGFSLEQEAVQNKYKKEIWEVSILLYRAIQFYRKRKATKTIKPLDNPNIKSSKPIGEKTQLDVILELLKFEKENRQLFLFLAKLKNSGNHRIHWPKTIASQTPLIQDGAVIYMNLLNKKKQINFDETLIVLFYSTLRYLHKQYAFPFTPPFGYKLLPEREIKKMLESSYSGMNPGTRLLKKIKRNYFTDKLRHLWNLLYAFFNSESKVKRGKNRNEYLLVKDFQLLFENMIDYLISDEDIPKKLKEQKDGKRVDHLYKAEGLVEGDLIYFIGDSKYYKLDDEGKNSFGPKEKAKQFTYAKNIIQYCIDGLANRTAEPFDVRYRDKETEGYNVTPNFFISAVVNETLDFSPEKEKLLFYQDSAQQQHFENRLFDRDTLFVLYYQIDFLYVLSTYARENATERDIFREIMKTKFREGCIQHLNDHYSFYKIKFNSRPELETFVEINFKTLNGKIYRSGGMEASNELLLALEKKFTPGESKTFQYLSREWKKISL